MPDRRIDKLLVGKWTGIPIMLASLALIFWLTIRGANYPSQWLSALFYQQCQKQVAFQTAYTTNHYNSIHLILCDVVIAYLFITGNRREGVAAR